MQGAGDVRWSDHGERHPGGGSRWKAVQLRQFAAWFGLTPKAHSSGGKERQVGVSKQGDGHLRRLLVIGATAVMRLTRKDNPSRSWAAKLLERNPAKLAAVALANKAARIVWAVMTRGEVYTPRAA